jgi:hypothetical protein
LFRIENKRKEIIGKHGGQDGKNKRVSDIDMHNNQDSRVYIVALSGLITDNIIEKGTKCEFDDFSKISFKIIII